MRFAGHFLTLSWARHCRAPAVSIISSVRFIIRRWDLWRVGFPQRSVSLRRWRSRRSRSVLYVAGVVPGLNSLFLSFAVICITTLALLWDLRVGSGFQNASTLLKVGLILVIVAAGFYVKGTQPVSFLPVNTDRALIVSPRFAISLYRVMSAYWGCNASTYIVGEVRNPARAIPLSPRTRHASGHGPLPRH